MSGRRIDDHSFWAGKGSEESVLPLGSKMKRMDSAEGAGEVSRYQDTEQEILRAQEDGERKVDRHRMKDGYRY